MKLPPPWRAAIPGHRKSEVAGVNSHFEKFTGSGPFAFVVSTNLHRRHLTESQRAMVAARIANLGDGQRADQAAQICAPVRQTDAADMLNVSRRAVQSATVVQREGLPELAAAVDSGAVSVSAAADVATRPHPAQAAKQPLHGG